MKAIKIWNKDIQGKDIYVDFRGNFQCSAEKKVTLRLSCDSIFTVFVNGEMAGFGSCSNFPKRKLYYTFDLTKFVKCQGSPAENNAQIAESSENELKVTVWHQGEESSTYFLQDAFLMLEVTQGKRVLLASGKNMECRVNPSYKQGLCKKITGQMGYSFYYDATAEDAVPYEKVMEYGSDRAEKTNIKNLKLLPRKNISVKETEDGFLIDLKKETVGFLDLDLDSDGEQELLISYGEHLTDGRVSRFIGGRDFSVEVKLKKGRNQYMNVMRRLAGRYLEIRSKNISIHYLGIRPAEYPVRVRKKKFEDKLLQKIYDVGVYTLKCCMHEHYEDCPWREQALYTMDSRNQMLCGYYAFKGTEFQKSSLLLIAHSIMKDGLLAICAPSSSDLGIPFFSLIYPMQVCEYVEHTGDRTVLRKVGKTVRKIMAAFDKKVEKNGLIASLPAPYWNFYEWNAESSNDTELSEGKSRKYVKRYDLILNAMYVYAHLFTDRLFGTKTELSGTISAIQRTFYDEERQAYRLSTSCEKTSILGNSLALLIGLGDEGLAQRLKTGEGFIPVTLSMNTFFYDALLKADPGNREWILENIKKKYAPMLKGKTGTFWETERGYEDFDNAGSLCHGWSAMPVFYLSQLQSFETSCPAGKD